MMGPEMSRLSLAGIRLSRRLVYIFSDKNSIYTVPRYVIKKSGKSYWSLSKARRFMYALDVERQSDKGWLWTPYMGFVCWGLIGVCHRSIEVGSGISK